MKHWYIIFSYQTKIGSLCKASRSVSSDSPVFLIGQFRKLLENHVGDTKPGTIILDYWIEISELQCKEFNEADK